MDLIEKYLEKHELHIVQTFSSMSKQQKLQATRIFNFFQSAFDQQEFRFELNGKDFLKQDQNSAKMERMLEQYYKQKSQQKTKKFQIYRVSFQLIQIKSILKYWLTSEPNLTVTYIQSKGEGEVSRGTIKLVNEMANQETKQGNVDQNNQFDMDDQKIEAAILLFESSIRELEDRLKKVENQQEKQDLQVKIRDYLIKIKLYEQRIKTNQKSSKQLILNLQRNDSESMKQSSKTSDSPKNTKKININFRSLFQFYAKQTHLTGVKTTFDRIQHESQSLNYQKLVHFLRQYNLVPKNGSDSKKIYALYLKNCDSTRDLSFEGFLKVLEGVSLLIWKQKDENQRTTLLKQKVMQKHEKDRNKKILNYPFHSPQRQDFRIKSSQINYIFNLKSQDGKLPEDITSSIQQRKKIKQQQKLERSKQKQQKKIQYLKKLQMIDPFSPLLQKNASLLQPKSTQNYQQVASLDNMQSYRDQSFDFNAHFGLEEQTNVQTSPDEKTKRSPSYRKGESMQKQVQRLQKYQQQKMKNLMNGLLQRNQSKLQKMGISPTKREKSVRYKI